MYSISFVRALGLATLVGTFAASAPAHAKKKRVRIKLATLAPRNSAWLQSIESMGRRWKEVSGGAVQLKVYPGGVAGDEGDVIRKIRIGQLQAATLTNIGLGAIDRGTLALQIPMMFNSYEELDYVRDRIGPKLAKSLEDRGFVVLGWGEAGWIHFFSKKKALTVDEMRVQRLFVTSGDPDAEAAWRAAGFIPVPTSSTDVLQGLQTGRIEAFATVPLYALASQWFGLAKHALLLKWAPLTGATVVKKEVWEKLDPELREKLAAIAVEETQANRDRIRSMGAKALKAMSDRGLAVHEPTEASSEAWRAAAAKVYPLIRGKVIPAVDFDEVGRLLAEFRAKKGS